MILKLAEPGSAPSPEVATEPFTSQYSGSGGAAGVRVADVNVMFGTPRAPSAAGVQSAHAGAPTNSAQSKAAHPNRKIENRNDANIAPRIFIETPSSDKFVF